MASAFWRTARLYGGKRCNCLYDAHICWRCRFSAAEVRFWRARGLAQHALGRGYGMMRVTNTNRQIMFLRVIGKAELGGKAYSPDYLECCRTVDDRRRMARVYERGYPYVIDASLMAVLAALIGLDCRRNKILLVTTGGVTRRRSQADPRNDSGPAGGEGQRAPRRDFGVVKNSSCSAWIYRSCAGVPASDGMKSCRRK